MASSVTPAFDTTPYWQVGTSSKPRFPSLDRDLTVDAVVIGGGVTGVTAAYLLKKAGLTVALVERGHCGQGETSHTTAHLTGVTDLSYPELVSSFGEAHAQAIWDAGFAAIAEIDLIVRREGLDCDFKAVPGYLHQRLSGKKDDDVAELKKQAEAAAKGGFDAEYMDAIPGLGVPGIRFDGQAKFHPLKYLDALVDLVPGDGCHVFEKSLVDEVCDKPLSVKVGSHTISTKTIIVATHVPIMGKTNALKATLLQTDLYPYSTYAVGAQVAKGSLPEALYWDLADPYHYLRVDAGSKHDIVVFGGGDHKTGQAEDTRKHFAEVESALESILPGAEVTHRWSGQVIETRDGLPYIGMTADDQFVITGFSGNGMTFGTLGAMMARDAVTGRKNPWSELFDAGRTRIEGLTDYLSENKDYPYYLVRDRLAGADAKPLRNVRRGEGRVIEVQGTRVAAYRDDDGKLTMLSPVCTHLGCIVNWNAAESSWDCPCHGSRFTATGKVMGGPAETPLLPIELASLKRRAG